MQANQILKAEFGVQEHEHYRILLIEKLSKSVIVYIHNKSRKSVRRRILMWGMKLRTLKGGWEQQCFQNILRSKLVMHQIGTHFMALNEQTLTIKPRKHNHFRHLALYGLAPMRPEKKGSYSQTLFKTIVQKCSFRSLIYFCEQMLTVAPVTLP